VRYELSRRASADIDAIILYTDQNFGSDQTEEYLSGLYYSFDLLCDNPKLGRVWSPGKRCYVYRSHYVFYRIMKDHLLITMIRNTRQELPPRS